MYITRTRLSMLGLWALCHLGLVLGTHAQTSPKAVGVFPVSQSITAEANTPIWIDFDTALDPQSVKLTVFGRWSGPATGSLTFEQGNTRIRFQPDTPFMAGEWVTVSLAKQAQSQNGDPLATSYTWNFWTKTHGGILDFAAAGTIPIRGSGEGHIQTYGAYAGDLNDDGWSDLAVVNEISSDVRVFLNDGSGQYGAFEAYPLPPGTRASTNEGADFNEDGIIDFAVGYQSNDLGQIGILMGVGDGSFEPVYSHAVAGGTMGLGVIELDGDGHMDIVTANAFTGDVGLIRGMGDGSFAQTRKIEANGTTEWGCAVADANNDGIQDVFVAARGSGEVILLLGDGQGGLEFSSKVRVSGDPWMLAAGDLNGDGNVDVVSSNPSQTLGDNNVAVMFGDGQGGLGQPQAYRHGIFPLAVDLGDLDGDGDLDLVSSNWTSNFYTVFENDGTGVFVNPRTFPASTNASCAILHDRDNDGDLDLTGTDETDDVILLYENVATPVAVEAETLPQPFALAPNYPNPFQGVTTISYHLAHSGTVTLRVFNALGQEVFQQPQGMQQAGAHAVLLNGEDWSAGVYGYELRVQGRQGTWQATGTMIRR